MVIPPVIPAISIVLAIAGGQPIDLPAAVVVEGAELMCTGSRIAEGVVLTAAHCLEQEGPFVVDGAENAAVVKAVRSVSGGVHSGHPSRDPKWLLRVPGGDVSK